MEKEQLKEVFEKGKDTVVETSKTILNAVNDGIDTVMENETVQEMIAKGEQTVNKVVQSEPVQQTVQKAKDGVDAFLNDENVKSGIRKFKKGTLKLADSAYEGLNRLLKDDDEIIIHEMHDSEGETN